MKITRFHKTVWFDFNRFCITVRFLRMKEFLLGFSVKNDKGKFILLARPFPFTEINLMVRRGYLYEEHMRFVEKYG